MVREETIDRVIAYVKKFPDIDPVIVRNGLSIFYLHSEIEMLAETYVAKRYGFSTRQVETLEALFHKQDKSLTPAQLAEEIHLTRSAMTSNLDSLQKRGYVSRTAHPNDRRRLIISLTKKGLELCDHIMPARYRDMSRVMQYLSPEMRETLHHIYNRLIENIRKMSMELIN